MPITRPNFEAIIVTGCGPTMTMAGLDGTTVDGTNASLNGPLGQALASLGLVPVDFSAVTSADLASLSTPDQYTQLIDVGRYYAMEAALGGFNAPDTVADTDNSKAFGKLRDSLEKTVERLRKQVEKQYGVGLGSLSAGVLDLGFQETLDPATGYPR